MIPCDPLEGQGDFKVRLLVWRCRSRRCDGVGGPRRTHEAPVEAGDLASRRVQPELRCAVSLPPSAWSSRPRVSTVRSARWPSGCVTLADPRCRRGKRHPFVAVLLIACSAVVSGATSLRGDRRSGRPRPRRTSWPGSVPVPRPPSTYVSRRAVRRSAGSSSDTCPGGLADLLGTRPGRGRHPRRGRQERPRLAPGRDPGRAPAGRDDRHRADRHPTASAGEDQRNHLFRRPAGPL